MKGYDLREVCVNVGRRGNSLLENIIYYVCTSLITVLSMVCTHTSLTNSLKFSEGWESSLLFYASPNKITVSFIV